MDAPFIDDDDQIDGASEAIVSKKNTDHQYFIGLGNNPRLVRDALSQYGFKEMAKGMQFSDKYRFKWTQTSSEINYMKFVEGQHLVNHISNAKIFTTKITTLETLEYLKIRLENGELTSSMKVSEFFPETYRLDIAADLVKFLNSKSEGLWLSKKAQSNQGKGIKLIANVNDYKEDLLTIKDQQMMSTGNSIQILMDKLKQLGIEDPTEEQKQEQSLIILEEQAQAAPKKKWKDMNMLAKELGGLVVQKYIENPLLVDGRKFDIRAYMLVVCMKPYLVVYHPGYVRMCLNKYTTENFSKDKLTHLTNNSVQKNHPDYKTQKEQSIISVDALIDDLLTTGRIGSRDEYKAKVDLKIQEIMKLVFTMISDKLDRKFGCYELFGFDFMIDDQLNPQLIEINTNPALYTDTGV